MHLAGWQTKVSAYVCVFFFSRKDSRRSLRERERKGVNTGDKAKNEKEPMEKKTGERINLNKKEKEEKNMRES